MPILSNPKHETFAQLLAQNKTAREAYVLSGYRDNRHNAARLKSSETVRQRVCEICEAGAKTAEVTVASLLAELEDARAKATSLNQLSAAVRATAEKAKISGLLIERQEVKVVSDDYEPTSAAEVLAGVVEKVGERAARALADAFNIEYDGVAVMALVNGDVNGNGVNSARAIEWLPPKADRKRQVG
jgi:hypothetical protein